LISCAPAVTVNRMFLAVIAVFGLSAPALSQSRVFVTGGIFADVRRFSGDAVVNTLDSTTIAAGGRVGVFLSERWVIDAGADVSRSATITRSIPLGFVVPPPIAIGVDPPPTTFQLRTTNRFLAMSVLVGFRPARSGRVHPGFLGGITFMHVTRTFDSAGPVPLAAFAAASTVQPIRSALGLGPHTLVDNVPAATVGFEVGLDFTRHLAVVPELRAHAVSLSNGGPTGFVFRPGVGARWTF